MEAFKSKTLAGWNQRKYAQKLGVKKVRREGVGRVWGHSKQGKEQISRATAFLGSSRPRDCHGFFSVAFISPRCPETAGLSWNTVTVPDR